MVLFAAALQYVFGFLMFASSLFLILLVLVQRGRGGGLAGAFGGMGGQSAFGTKAGDLFTKLTMGVATFWILLCIAAIATLNSQESAFGTGADATARSGLEATGDQADEELGDSNDAFPGLSSGSSDATGGAAGDSLESGSDSSGAANASSDSDAGEGDSGGDGGSDNN